jgi:hypothetical protein
MRGRATIDISADLHESLGMLEADRRVPDNVEDRVLAETLRKDGYDDARLKVRFGYVPSRIGKGSRPRTLDGPGIRVDHARPPTVDPGKRAEGMGHRIYAGSLIPSLKGAVKQREIRHRTPDGADGSRVGDTPRPVVGRKPAIG